LEGLDISVRFSVKNIGDAVADVDVIDNANGATVINGPMNSQEIRNSSARRAPDGRGSITIKNIKNGESELVSGVRDGQEVEFDFD
jgi:hypothetical protein